MAPPGNGIFVVRGEMSTLITAMKRGARWNSTSHQEEEQDALMKQFVELKLFLIQTEDLRLIEPNMFLAPFLDVIRSEETSGPITSLALTSINKFLSYGLIDPTHPALPSIVENIADAVTHCRFVGTDQGSDAVVLMKVIQVLRTLMLSPEGSALTNENVCEVMLSCFRICFEPRLNELLRKTAEHALKDIVLLLFMRLPQFAEERQGDLMRKLKMIAGGGGSSGSGGGGGIETSGNSKKQRKSKIKNLSKTNFGKKTLIKADEIKDNLDNMNVSSPTIIGTLNTLKAPILATTPATPAGNIVDMQGKFMQTPTSTITTSINVPLSSDVIVEDGNMVKVASLEKIIDKSLFPCEDSIDNDADVEEDVDNNSSGSGNGNGNKEETDSKPIEAATERKVEDKNEDFVNSMGVRFIPQAENESAVIILTPYGLPCIRELLRFIVSLCNPLDKQNTDTMIHIGLSLLTVALEVGADSIGKYDTLLTIVKDDMCKHLFSLLNTERLTIYAADLQVCFLLFESLRVHLKFHLEYYLAKLSEIISNENLRLPYEIRELSLDNILQFLRIPGFAAELYINYDCNLYCTNLLEDLIKLLSKNSLSATQTIHSIHQISLDGLLTIILHIERNCLAKKDGKIVPAGRHSRNNSNADKIIIEIDVNTSGGESSGIENINNFICARSSGSENKKIQLNVTREQLAAIKKMKRTLTQGTELFNKNAENGIQFLQENGILNTILDPTEIAHFLRENSGLDKMAIGTYVSKKKNVERKILEHFVKSFDFANCTIDAALRQYLETFRLPGEAPLISLVMEHFADHWHKCNNEPFANTDSAFKLAYAIIMLNMDQHNYNAKRLNVPMTPDDFVKNLRGCDGNGDFNQDMLIAIYNSIKTEEIVMPAEQTGLVRENYLWKVLLRRNATKDGQYSHVDQPAHDEDLFQLAWGPTLAALSFMFDKSTDLTYQKSLSGLLRGAVISSHFNLHENLDALILTLCKFTTLLNVPADANDLVISVNFGLNTKAQLTLKTVFTMIHEHGDSMRESWTNILDVIVQLFKLKLLPKTFMETEDFCAPSGKVTLVLEKPLPKSELGLFGSLYSYLSSEAQRQPTYEEQDIIKLSKRCVKECQIEQIIAESKFLQFESLQRLIKCLISTLKVPNTHKSVGLPYPEDIVVFLMELLVKILIQNRDRVLPLWNCCRDQMYLLLMGSSSCGYQYLLIRTTVALLKLAIYLMRNEELCSTILQSLKMLLMLKPNVIYSISKQISIGMYELLKTSAQNIHTETDWDIVFTILQCVGAGAMAPVDIDENTLPIVGAKSDGAVSSEDDSGLPDRGYTSDSEIIVKSDNGSSSSTPFLSPNGENWILVNKDSSDASLTCSATPINSLTYHCKLLGHSAFALVKCWDSLAFIVRNVAHITPYNFESCVRCIRTFVEASLNGGEHQQSGHHYNHYYNSAAHYPLSMAMGGKMLRRKSGKKDQSTKNRYSNVDSNNSSDSDDEDLVHRYDSIAIQLLDLMHTLHTRTAQIFRWWAEEGGAIPQCSALWANGWCPLLQGIARLANDRRREVRTSALTCLQRALLVHDLQTLSGPEWYSCFKQVLFPLLFDLLMETTKTIEQLLLEESRTRTATIMSKVFLHHLSPLILIPTFGELWIEILDYLEKFMKIGSDMLYEAILESLKNMLLVMHSVGVFHNTDGVTHTQLWDITWKKITAFLPDLKDDIFRNEDHTTSHNKVGQSHHSSVHSQQQLPTEIPPIISVKPTQFLSVAEEIPAPIQNVEIINQTIPAIEEIKTMPILLQNLPTSDNTPIIQSPQILHPSSNLTTTTQTPNKKSPISTIIDPIISESTENNLPKIPISHLIGINAYPTLTTVPENIAKSFAPIFVQPQNQQTKETDIYTDYVNNPYNLTLRPLQVDNTIVTTPVVTIMSSTTTTTTTIITPGLQSTTINAIESNQSDAEIISIDKSQEQLTVANIFQSANYFNSDSVIPPGSEMLFDGP